MLGCILDPKVEPDWAVECHLLIDEQVGEFIGERLDIHGGREVASLDAPLSNPPNDSADQLLDASFPSGLPHVAPEILGDHNVGRQLRPRGGNLHVDLLENRLTFFVANICRSEFPFDRVEGISPGHSEPAGNLQSYFPPRGPDPLAAFREFICGLY